MVRLPETRVSSWEKREKWYRDTLWIYFTGELESVRVCEIGVGGGDGKDDGVGLCDVLEDHVPDLLLDILWLVADGDLCETGDRRG